MIAAAAIAFCAAGLAVTLRSGSPRPEASSAQSRPRLLLLTSLPILFNEDFTIDGSGSPALKVLRASFDVVPISVADGAELRKGQLLLMAQPFAQTPENLEVLDEWVRRGGRVLLLADPLLQWPSKRSLGDLTRPPPMFGDTGLLAHWGLRLDPPEQLGVVIRQMGKYKIATLSPGRLSGACRVRDGGLDAQCRIGQGQAIVVADADFLNTTVLGRDGQRNLDALLEQLASLRKS